MSEDDVLFGYRLRVFDYAARASVSEACRVFGIHRLTYYIWTRRVERYGLEILRPRERRRPRMPNQLSPFVEERVVAFALGHPGFGPQRIASELRKARWGGLDVSHNDVWRSLRRHGLQTRQKRLALVAGYAAPYEPPRAPEPERHVEAERPGELVGMDCFFVGRLAGTKGLRLAGDRDRRRLLVRVGRARPLPARIPHWRPGSRHDYPGTGCARDDELLDRLELVVLPWLDWLPGVSAEPASDFVPPRGRAKWGTNDACRRALSCSKAIRVVRASAAAALLSTSAETPALARKPAG